ncbi:MAG: helix-turn-helix domain-containing protein [Clostridia bacterium]|nr:helix-turn-helix domain-containing protein [Clostridia bacterium]
MNYTNKELYGMVLKEYPDIMDISAMCQALRISEKTGYKLIKNGQITAMKVGRAYRIPKMHVLSYLKLTNANAA